MKLIKILNEAVEEALELSTAKKYASIVRSPEVDKRMDDIFSELKKDPNYVNQSRNGERLYFDVVSTDSDFNIEDDIRNDSRIVRDETFKLLQDQLRQMDLVDNLKVTDFINGEVIPNGDTRPMKIGRLITKAMKKYSNNQVIVNILEDLLKKYNESTLRNRYKKDISSSYIIISRAKYDVAGMSTGRGWTSCMTLGSKKDRAGVFSNKVHCDVEEGTIIAYLVNKKDTNIKNPIGRVLIKPYINVNDPSDIYYGVEDNTYPVNAPIVFRDNVVKMFKGLQSNKLGSFKLNPSLYRDSSNYTIEPNPITNINSTNYSVYKKDDKWILSGNSNVLSIEDVEFKNIENASIFDNRKLSIVKNIKIEGWISISNCIKVKKISDIEAKDLFVDNISLLDTLENIKLERALFLTEIKNISPENIKNITANVLVLRDCSSVMLAYNSFPNINYIDSTSSYLSALPKEIGKNSDIKKNKLILSKENFEDYKKGKLRVPKSINYTVAYT